MRKRVLQGVFVIIFSILSVFSAQAQNSDNYLELSTLVYTNALLNTPELLENDMVAPSALMVSVETKDRAAFIYAAIPLGIKTSSNQTIPTNKIILKLNNTNCNPGQQRQVITTDIPMSATPQLLFEQGKKTNSVANWYYNVTLQALGYSYAPGTYNFTLQFTMTQP